MKTAAQGFRIEHDKEGEFGVRMVLEDGWHDHFGEVIRREKVTWLMLSWYAGWTDTDLSFLSLFPGMRAVEVYSWDVTDLTPLYALQGLEYLGFQVGLKKAFDLGKFPHLKRLFATCGPRVSNIAACTQLNYLNAVNYPAVDLTPISGCCGLNQLRLESRKLHSLHGINNLKALKWFSLFDCRCLESLGGIDTLDQLQTIKVRTCRKIARFPDLSRLGKLKELCIEDCGELESIQCLRGCNSLERVLIIGDTTIKDGDLSVLKTLPNLKEVRVRKRRHYNLSNQDILLP